MYLRPTLDLLPFDDPALIPDGCSCSFVRGEEPHEAQLELRPKALWPIFELWSIDADIRPVFRASVHVADQLGIPL